MCWRATTGAGSHAPNRRRANGGDENTWCGTYDVELQFPKGQHQIELKIISREKAVCSIVLSNWKVNVR